MKLPAKPDIKIKVTRANAKTVLVHVMTADASRWFDLTVDQAVELRDAIQEALNNQDWDWETP